MHPTIRKFFSSVPILDKAYCQVRILYNGRRTLRNARKVFRNNHSTLRRALTQERVGQRIDLYTHDGLHFVVRQNRRDALTLAEVFIDAEYSRGFDLPPNPVVVDIGGYIGDFAIYAARHLHARKVITVEPSPHNYALLETNIRLNHYQDRIFSLLKAVTNGKSVMLNIDAPEAAQMRVSAWSEASELKEVPGISLAQIMKDFDIPVIDLLKIDCEGGEYDILLTAPLSAIRNIIFEHHTIDNSTELLAQVKQRLASAGFALQTCGRGANLISAKLFAEPLLQARRSA